MKPKTEEFLYFLLWTVELLSRPTSRNLTESYEAWAYRHGLLRQARSLERQKLLERVSGIDDRVFRLTEAGRLHALGGRDPSLQWARAWDGQWRLALFDVPREHDTKRVQLRRFLRSRHFGCLQGSVWVSPEPLPEIPEDIESESANVKSLILLKATPSGGETDPQIVNGAWDFEEINSCYTQHMKVLDQMPSASLGDSAAATTLQRWATREREAWFEAVSQDPLLPESLLPKDYLGRQAWRKRVQVLAKAGDLLRNFSV